jgi:tetratricopeptide (TPR) repeat protein
MASHKALLHYEVSPMEEWLTLEPNLYGSIPGSYEGYANGDMKRNGIPKAFDRGTFVIRPIEQLALNPWWYLKEKSWSYWYYLALRMGENIDFPDATNTAEEKLSYIAANSWVYTYQLANDSYRLGDFAATLSYYDELISRHPTSLLFYQDKAISLCHLQRFDEAREVRKRLPEISGDSGLNYDAAHAFAYISLLA